MNRVFIKDRLNGIIMCGKNENCEEEKGRRTKHRLFDTVNNDLWVIKNEREGGHCDGA